MKGQIITITVCLQNVWNETPCAFRNRLIRSLISSCNADICLFQECVPRTTRTGKASLPKLLKLGFSDIRNTAKTSTDCFTHHDYPTLTDDEAYINGPLPVRNLDYIFTYGKEKLSPESFEILLSQTVLNSSDHCPLIGKFAFQ